MKEILQEIKKEIHNKLLEYYHRKNDSDILKLADSISAFLTKYNNIPDYRSRNNNALEYIEELEAGIKHLEFIPDFKVSIPLIYEGKEIFPSLKQILKGER